MTNSGFVTLHPDKGSGIEYVAQAGAPEDLVAFRVAGEVWPRLVIDVQTSPGRIMVGDGTVPPVAYSIGQALIVGVDVEAWSARLDTLAATSDTGSGAVVRANSPTLSAPAITTPTGIVKADVGLGNVDNTADANKPVSSAAATAIAAKVDKSTLTTDGDLYTRAGGVVVRLTRAALAADSAFTSAFDAAGVSATETTARTAADVVLTAAVVAETARAIIEEAFAAWNIPDHGHGSHLDQHGHDEAPIDAVSGVATGGSTTTVIETGRGWTANAYAGAVGKLTSGTGAGQYFVVLSNTSDTLTVTADGAPVFNASATPAPLAVAAAPGSGYLVWGGTPIRRSNVAVRGAWAKNLGTTVVQYEDPANLTMQQIVATATPLPVSWSGHTLLVDGVTVAIVPTVGTSSTWSEATGYRQQRDLTYASSARLSGQVTTLLAGASVRAEYSADSGSTWATLGTSDIAISVAATGVVTSSRIPLASAAKADVLLRFTANGSAATPAPALSSLALEFR